MAACRRPVNTSRWRSAGDRTRYHRRHFGGRHSGVEQDQRFRQKDNGQSWRMRYGKNFVETGTNFSLASYRYSTEGFYSMQEALDSYNNAGNMYYYNHKRAVPKSLSVRTRAMASGHLRSAVFAKSTGTAAAKRNQLALAITTAGKVSATA